MLFSFLRVHVTHTEQSFFSFLIWAVEGFAIACGDKELPSPVILCVPPFSFVLFQFSCLFHV